MIGNRDDKEGNDSAKKGTGMVQSGKHQTHTSCVGLPVTSHVKWK
jgi:hypothetical protein